MSSYEDMEDGPDLEDEAVEFEVTDVLDLHTFPPREVRDLVRDYLDMAYEKGFRRLRIIHGKGTGTQRRMVRSILDKAPRVVRYGDPPDGSSWGATVVEMADEA